MKRIRVGIIGIGDRGLGFVHNFLAVEDLGEVTGIYDLNRPRAQAMAKWFDFESIPRHDTWNAFVRGGPYDLVVVTTPDNTHADVVVQCLEGGYHVFCEKPLASTPEDLVRILEAYDRCDRMLLMGFNMRYHNIPRKMREIVQRGELGQVKVGTCHHPEQGIRYFRRWHKYRAKVGGLVIHKGCHALDIMNWVLGSYPVEVYAQGGLAVFRGDKQAPGCHACDELATCPFARRLDHRETRRICDTYIGPSKVDGYTYNYCPISAEEGLVPDFYLVTVRYASGARATYSEIHFAAKSRVHWGLFGDKAELSTTDAGSLQRLNLLSGERAVYDVPRAAGGHGGADPVMTIDIIASIAGGRSLMPSPEAGVRSSIIGIAAMNSIDQGRPVKVEELIPLDYLKRGPDQDVRYDATIDSTSYTDALGS